MRFDIITIFPEIFDALKYGIVGRAIKKNLITINCINPRDYSDNRFNHIDDRSYGGGPGMVMMIEPLLQSIRAAKAQSSNTPHVVYLSPQGKLLDQSGVSQLAKKTHLIMLAGRYEGIDERLVKLEVDSEWSIGDYVLSGGELAIAVIIDVITRTIPNALGDAQSAQQDSFASGLLDYPHYTRPANFSGEVVPEVLLGGNHKLIACWRLKQALGRTWLRRPELLQKLKLTQDEILLLNEFINENRD